jgi:putative peptide zinc metalloprotease protein
MWKIGKFFYVPGRIHKVKKTRFFLSLAALAGIIAFIVFYPLPHSVFAPLHLKLQDEAEIVRVPAVGGRLLDLYVEPGDQVEQGEVLARLKNTDLMLEILALKEQKNQLETQLANLRRQRISDPQAEFNIPPLEASLKMINNQIAEKQWDLSDLELKAQHSGTVIPPAWQKKQEDDQSQKLATWWGSPLQKKNLGAYLEPSTNFCEIGNPRQMKAEVVIDESDIDFVGLRQQVELMLEELPGVVFPGEIIKIEENEMDTIPPQLSTNYDGDIPTEPNPETGQEAPKNAKYRAIVLLSNDDGFMQVGMTGQAKIHTPPQTLARRAIRFINETFSFTLN